MISYEVVEKIMKFSKIKFFFDRVIKKPDFQPQSFRVFLGQKWIFWKNRSRGQKTPT